MIASSEFLREMNSIRLAKQVFICMMKICCGFCASAFSVTRLRLIQTAKTVKPQTIGDPTETALLVAAIEKFGFECRKGKVELSKIARISF